MLNIFKRKKTNAKIKFVSLPDLGWELDKKDKSIIQWMNPDHVMVLSLHFFTEVPDIPSIHDLEMLRKFYRYQITDAGGGLIQADITKVGGYAAAKTIFKLPQENGAFTYLSSITIPFANCSYVIKIQAPDLEASGKREALITDQLLKKGELEVDGKEIKGWRQDPYQSDYAKGSLMNQSEKEVYDKDFPDHPLSMSREFLKLIEAGVSFDVKLTDEPRFKR